MKKLLLILLVMSLTLLLFACRDDECKSHTDTDGNYKCDVCGEELPKTPVYNPGEGVQTPVIPFQPSYD